MLSSKSQSCHVCVVNSRETSEVDRCDCCHESFEKMSQCELQNLVHFSFHCLHVFNDVSVCIYIYTLSIYLSDI